MSSGLHATAKHTVKTEWFMGITAAVIALTALGLGEAFGQIRNSSLRRRLRSSAPVPTPSFISPGPSGGS
jgi:hypothetical protein